MGVPHAKPSRSLLAGCVVAAFLPAAEAVAQGAERHSARGTVLEEVIVTARRREETAQEAPVLMTVLDRELLERYAIRDLHGVADLTPGLFTGESAGAVGGSISLRGVTSGESQPLFDQAVSLNVDGVPISTGQMLRVAQMDLAQIEVLRGPQALFFGKNSPGGIISLVTADPGPEPEALLRTGYEFEGDEWFVDATYSTPLGERAGLRLAAHRAEMDGYIDVHSPVELIPDPNPGIEPSGLDSFPEREETFLRATLTFDPSDRLSAKVKATFADTEVRGSPSYFHDIVYCPYGTPQEPYPVASNCRNDEEIVTARIPANVLALNPQLEPDGHRDNEQLLLSGTLEYRIGEHLTLTSVTGYYDADEDSSSNGGYGLAPTNVWAVNYSYEQWSEELRLASDFAGPLNFLAGVFFESRELYTDTYIVIPTVGVCPSCFELPFEGTRQENETYSAFAQLLWDIDEAWQLSAGARYTEEDKRLADYFIAAEAPFDPAPVLAATRQDLVGSPSYPGQRRLSFDDLSPEVTLSWRPAAHRMYFLSYKEGFKSGGFDGAYTAGAVLARGVRTFDPEEVQGFEGGLKSSWFDGQLIFNLTGYWYEYDDLQVSTYDVNARAFGTANAARSTVQGIELETRYAPDWAPDFEVHLAAAWNDAEYDEFFAQCYRSQNQAMGCRFDVDPATGRANTQDLSGKRMRRAPEWTAALGASWERALASGWVLGLAADLLYSDDYVFGTDYQPYARQDSFTKLNACGSAQLARPALGVRPHRAQPHRRAGPRQRHRPHRHRRHAGHHRPGVRVAAAERGLSAGAGPDRHAGARPQPHLAGHLALLRRRGALQAGGEAAGGGEEVFSQPPHPRRVQVGGDPHDHQGVGQAAWTAPHGGRRPPSPRRCSAPRPRRNRAGASPPPGRATPRRWGGGSQRSSAKRASSSSRG
ncbi:MAG: hypothetical protein KatS3mg124_0612 [Porticoccaceae bacterium]|nr:MAG: hypothetical protein KatS3mg124_0612 [Porticoccaceae bacterium]